MVEPGRVDAGGARTRQRGLPSPAIGGDVREVSDNRREALRHASETVAVDDVRGVGRAVVLAVAEQRGGGGG